MIESIGKILLPKHYKPLKSNMELRDSQSGMKVELTDLPERGLLITVPPEREAHLDILRDNIKGLKLSCDYLLLIENENQMDVCFIELKKTANEITIEKAEKQILCTKPVWDYLVSMAEVHCQKEIRRRPPHFAVIATRHSRLNKQRVKSSRRKKTIKLIVSKTKIPLQMLCPRP